MSMRIMRMSQKSATRLIIFVLSLLLPASAAIPQHTALSFCGPELVVGQNSGPKTTVAPSPAGPLFCGSLLTIDSPTLETNVEAGFAKSGCDGTWSNGRCVGHPRNC